MTMQLPNRWRILALVGIAQLMLILDVTVVALALPTMQDDLGIGRETLTWVVSGYTLVFGGLLLLGGRAADLLGPRRLILAGLSLFAVASLTAGLASSGPVLLAGRVAQGAAAAMLSPAALSLVVTIFDGEERNRALGIWSALGGTGAALGVLVGGALTAGPGWPWVFFVNVPIGLVLVLLLRVQLPDARPVARGRIDVIGAALITAATGALIYALIQAGDDGWLTVTTLALAVASAIAYGLFVARQRTAATPLVNLPVLARRDVGIGLLLILVATAMLITVFFLGTFSLQQERGYEPLETGLLFLPVALATMVGANAAGRLIGHTGPRPLGVVGLLVAAVGMALPAIVDTTAMLIVGIAIVGAGTGVAFVVASATALGQVPAEHAGMASGALSTFHEFGASLGAAVASSAAATTFGAQGSGIADGFTLAAIAAVVAAIVTALAAAPRPQPAVA